MYNGNDATDVVTECITVSTRTARGRGASRYQGPAEAQESTIYRCTIVYQIQCHIIGGRQGKLRDDDVGCRIEVTQEITATTRTPKCELGKMAAYKRRCVDSQT